ncbi:uncharacterized protein [Chlorocebus sabaeus]|uniref:uncharacterized protein n=1 Tax=Chlorocebus sabaeus TaxID=60711 RepID=UPI0018B03E99|nr:uncharacterized protein LOC103237152 [Chlorocebus sabaeus]
MGLCGQCVCSPTTALHVSTQVNKGGAAVKAQQKTWALSMPPEQPGAGWRHRTEWRSGEGHRRAQRLGRERPASGKPGRVGEGAGKCVAWQPGRPAGGQAQGAARCHPPPTPAPPPSTRCGILPARSTVTSAAGAVERAGHRQRRENTRADNITIRKSGIGAEDISDPAVDGSAGVTQIDKLAVWSCGPYQGTCLAQEDNFEAL